jgi:hypothetical protein
MNFGLKELTSAQLAWIQKGRASSFKHDFRYQNNWKWIWKRKKNGARKSAETRPGCVSCHVGS